MRSQDSCDPAGGQDLQVFLPDGAEVLRLQCQGGKLLFDLFQGPGRGPDAAALAGKKFSGDPRHGQKIPPGQGNGVHLPHIRQDLVDIAAKDRVERHQYDLIGPESIPLPVKQPGDAL